MKNVNFHYSWQIDFAIIDYELLTIVSQINTTRMIGIFIAINNVMVMNTFHGATTGKWCSKISNYSMNVILDTCDEIRVYLRKPFLSHRIYQGLFSISNSNLTSTIAPEEVNKLLSNIVPWLCQRESICTRRNFASHLVAIFNCPIAIHQEECRKTFDKENPSRLNN